MKALFIALALVFSLTIVDSAQAQVIGAGGHVTAKIGGAIVTVGGHVSKGGYGYSSRRGYNPYRNNRRYGGRSVRYGRRGSGTHGQGTTVSVHGDIYIPPKQLRNVSSREDDKQLQRNTRRVENDKPSNSRNVRRYRGRR